MLVEALLFLGLHDTPSPSQWQALRMCESSNIVDAVSRTGKYRGLYQFDLNTWRSVGGVGDPAKASRSEQHRRAMLLHSKRGWKPWPHCGKVAATTE